jgi:coenzyme F420-reducing hydrogenase beta subunit
MRHFASEASSAAALVAPRDIVASGLCIGCGSCAASESKARMAWDRDGQLKPHGPAEWFERPSLEFSRTCPFSPSVANEDEIAGALYPAAAGTDGRIGRFQANYVGHVAEQEWRQNGSSGGLVSWVAAELLRTGAVDAVAHVSPADPHKDDRFFHYRLSYSPDEVRAGAKSRYYPIELSAVLREIRATPGRYAVVGVPCFIKAVNLVRRADPLIARRITHTLGLFCGHMKSARLVQSFAWQLGAELRQVRALDYRIKDAGRPANWYRAHLELDDGSSRGEDWWHLVDGDWGAGFFQNPACDMCDDVVAETADIAFGDAWVEPYSSDGRGTNVVITRSAEMQQMLETGIASGRLALRPVDAEFIADTQAAGLRHRREGLAYRLTWRRRGLRPCKRVGPDAAIPLRRKLIYRMRAFIRLLSHRAMRLARTLRAPRVYIAPSRAALGIYRALAWSYGPLGRIIDRLLPPPAKS